MTNAEIVSIQDREKIITDLKEELSLVKEKISELISAQQALRTTLTSLENVGEIYEGVALGLSLSRDLAPAGSDISRVAYFTGPFENLPGKMMITIEDRVEEEDPRPPVRIEYLLDMTPDQAMIACKRWVALAEKPRSNGTTLVNQLEWAGKDVETALREIEGGLPDQDADKETT